MKNLIDSIVEAFKANDNEIVYRYRKNIIYGQTQTRPEDDEDIIGINGRGGNSNPKFPDTEIDIDLRNGNVITYRDGHLFSQSNLNDYDRSLMMDQLMNHLDRDGFFDPV